MLQVEQEEECITNKLMKRLKKLRDEKETLANEVENEEEYLVNNLQKRLQKVNGEKMQLENQLEIEQEYVVNKLQKAASLSSQDHSCLAVFRNQIQIITNKNLKSKYSLPVWQ